MGLDLNLSVGGAGNPGAKYGGGDWPLGCVQVADVDSDGHPDLLLCAKGEHDRSQRLHLFHNDGGKKFTDVSAQVGLTTDARDAVFADMNGDGRPDVVTINGSALTILIQNADHKFTVAYRLPVKNGWRIAVGDATGDGQPDIYVARGTNAPGPDIPDFILINRGNFHFDKLALPAVPGTVRADDVYAINALHQKNKIQFLVLHGHVPKPVPVAVQLFEVS
jgi:hypothetical protein